ncbi:MAG: NAD(P)-dependent alcohol dehydrogenase [Anaerolineales bacterium]|nr:NAD(P)-dependent alcohol dehydrogenase [Anaerolineales bacterium]
MQAIFTTTYGSADVLQSGEMERPNPRPGEILVQVMATGLNRADGHLLSGAMRFSTGLLRPRQLVPGSDVAGRVVAVGSGTGRFQVGDEVFADLSAEGRGGLAEYVAAPATAFALKPPAISFAAAAATPMAAVTALQGLRDYGALQAGQRVLINGASGGVGTFAVQIAKALGAWVTAVCSSGKVEMVRSLGADQVIDYKVEDFTQADEQYDLIFDTVGNHAAGTYRRLLPAGGHFVTTSFLPGLPFLKPWVALTESKTLHNMLARPNAIDLATIGGWLASGMVRPVIDRQYPLAAAPEALRYLTAGHARGKVVIQVAPEPEMAPLTQPVPARSHQPYL